MNTSDSFGTQSPILNKPRQKLVQNGSSTKHKSLENIHERLLQHLKKSNTLSRSELKTYFDQIQKFQPSQTKEQWLLMKIKGLLNYIIKKRSDFQCSIVKGEITIYEKSASQQATNICEVSEPPQFHSQPATNSEFELDFLTNNNFMTIDSDPKFLKMEVESTCNVSKDLFSDSVEALHTYSQENYKILQHLTDKTENSSSKPINVSDETFKRPQPLVQVDQVYKIHDEVEKSYDSLLLTPSTSQACFENEPTDVKMRQSGDEKNQSSTESFDDCNKTLEELNKEFDLLYDDTDKWFSQIVNSIKELQMKENKQANSKFGRSDINKQGNTSVFDENNAFGCNNSNTETYLSEENMEIIREVRFEFKRQLVEGMKTNKSLAAVHDLLQSSDLL